MTKHISRPVPRQPSAKVARSLLLKVRDVNGDVARVVARAGLTATPEAILRPSWKGPLSPEQFTALYRECVILLETHDSRRQGRPPMTKSEVDMLCYCVISCGTLIEAIGRAADFCAMLDGRAAILSLVRSHDIAEFRMRTIRRRREVAGFLSDLTGLSTYHRLFSWLIGEDIEPLSVELSYPCLIEEDVTARIMPHPIAYDREVNLLRFPAHYLDRPIVRSYAELVELLVSFPFDLEAIQSKTMPFSERVRMAIGAALARRAPLPTLQALAGQFSISSATLKRRLADEGVSIQQLKERCRYELARDLIADPALAIGEIAQRLSFSEGATFSRAFKAWTGLSPSASRHRPMPIGSQTSDRL